MKIALPQVRCYIIDIRSQYIYLYKTFFRGDSVTSLLEVKCSMVIN